MSTQAPSPMSTTVPTVVLTQAHMFADPNLYRIAYTKYARYQTEHWTTRHVTIEETANTAQEFCVSKWPEPPTELKEITYYTDHSLEGGTLDDPLQVAALVMRHQEVIDGGHTLTLMIESYQHDQHGMIPQYKLEICKPAAIEARQKAIADRRRAAGRVHHCGDSYCDGSDCDVLPCGCVQECCCRRSRRRYGRDPEDW